MTPLLRTFLILATTVLGFYLLSIGKNLIVPLVIAVFIWYLINVLSNVFGNIRILGHQIPAILRYIVAGTVIVFVIIAIFNFISFNIGKFIEAAPAYQQRIQPLVDRIIAWLPIEELPSVREFARQIDFRVLLSRTASSLAAIAGNTTIILIYVLLIFLEQRSFRPKIQAMFSRQETSEEIFSIISQIDHDTRKYITIKTFTSALTGIVSYGIMAALQLDFAPFWGVLIFVLNFLPTIGSFIATAFPSMLSLIVYDSLAPIFGIVLGVTAVQVVVGSFLEPRLMGSSLNLSPLIILLSLGLWGSIWGITGMFLCVPITAITMIICSHFPATRPFAAFLSGDGKIRGTIYRTN